MPTPTAATQAYASIAKLGDPMGLAKAATSAGAGTPSFGTMLKDVVGAIGETTRKSDAQAQLMATGKANVVDVVTAVAETEVAIDALVAVRDRVIQAYEEIMRMPI
jgi:flagellar hook-basal body complex protein FliE